MKILLISHGFHPQVGGLETVAMLLAKEFVARGHEVRVVTQSPAVLKDNGVMHDKSWPFLIHRKPNAYQFLRLARWCDVFFQNNVSLRSLWPLLFVRRPWVVAHQTWLTRVDGRLGWQDRLKLNLLPFSRVGTSSNALSMRLKTASEIVGNPYQSDLFGLRPDISRDQPLVFVGRLVSEKGMDLLLEALSILKREHHLTPALTVVGEGPERPVLESQAQELGVAAQVNFVGQKTNQDLVRLLNRHRIIVVPSHIEEPFGIVALEGIACGCVAVGSAGGGLSDAIGPCGLLFPNRDALALALALQRVLLDEELCTQLCANASAHLAKFSSHQIADTYLKIFDSTLAVKKAG